MNKYMRMSGLCFGYIVLVILFPFAVIYDICEEIPFHIRNCWQDMVSYHLGVKAYYVKRFK